MENLHYIRQTMESAGAFTSVPGKGGIVMGLVAVGAAVLAAQPAFAEQWLAIWLAAGVLAVLAGGTAMSRKARSRGEQLLGAIGRRFLLGLLPPIVAAAILTPVLAQTGSMQLAASAWLLLYGTAVVAGGAFSIRLVPALGLAFMLLGAATLLAPPSAANLFLGIGFGGLHIVFGTLIARRHGG